jgi:hypothetical protein
MIPFIGFAPDLDPNTPGVITSCVQVIPTLKGMAGAPTANDAGLDALAAACRGAAVLTRLDNTRRIFAGTQTKMYELSSTSWVDVSKVGNYTGSTENTWRYGQFGNVSLAANQTERIQFSSSGAFADIAQAPKARIIVTASGFVMALGINDAAVGGDRPDAWWNCNIYDYVTWTPASSNQAAFGYLLDTPGEIRAGKALGPDIVAYKERSIYLGRFVGPPVVWQWQLIASDVGALSNECVVDTGTAHLFISRDDFWLFDGSRPRSIGAPVREWFFRNSDPTYRYKTRGYYDRFTGRVWWFYPSTSSGGALTDALIYNIKSDRWGYAQLNAQCVLDYVNPETTWDNWPPGVATNYENIVDLPFDSPAFDTDTALPAIFGTDNKIKTLVGACTSSSIITGDVGDDTQYTTLTAVKPRFISRPTAATLTTYSKEYQGDSLEVRETSSLDGNKFDALSSGRLHRMKFDLTGDYEMVGYTPDVVADGEE